MESQKVCYFVPDAHSSATVHKMFLNFVEDLLKDNPKIQLFIEGTEEFTVNKYILNQKTKDAFIKTHQGEVDRYAKAYNVAVLQLAALDKERYGGKEVKVLLDVFNRIIELRKEGKIDFAPAEAKEDLFEQEAENLIAFFTYASTNIAEIEPKEAKKMRGAEARDSTIFLMTWAYYRFLVQLYDTKQICIENEYDVDFNTLIEKGFRTLFSPFLKSGKFGFLEDSVLNKRYWESEKIMDSKRVPTQDEMYPTIEIPAFFKDVEKIIEILTEDVKLGLEQRVHFWRIRRQAGIVRENQHVPYRNQKMAERVRDELKGIGILYVGLGHILPDKEKRRYAKELRKSKIKRVFLEKCCTGCEIFVAERNRCPKCGEKLTEMAKLCKPDVGKMKEVLDKIQRIKRQQLILKQDILTCLEEAETALFLGTVAKKCFIKRHWEDHKLKNLDFLLTICIPLLTCLKTELRKEFYARYVDRYLKLKKDPRKKVIAAITAFDEFYFGNFMDVINELKGKEIVIRNVKKRGRINVEKLKGPRYYVSIKGDQGKVESFVKLLADMKRVHTERLDNVSPLALENILILFNDLGFSDKLVMVMAGGSAFRKWRVTPHSDIDLRIVTTEDIFHTLKKPLKDLTSGIYVQTGVVVDVHVTPLAEGIKIGPRGTSIRMWETLGSWKPVYTNPDYELVSTAEDELVDQVIRAFEKMDALPDLCGIVLRGSMRSRKAYTKTQVVRVIVKKEKEEMEAELKKKASILFRLTGTQFQFLVITRDKVNQYQRYPHSLKRVFNGRLLYADKDYVGKIFWLAKKHNLNVGNLDNFRTD